MASPDRGRYPSLSAHSKPRSASYAPLLCVQRGERLKAEEQTEAYDSEAMKYLSYVLYPLVIAGAVYQLVYSSYKR